MPAVIALAATGRLTLVPIALMTSRPTDTITAASSTRSMKSNDCQALNVVSAPGTSPKSISMPPAGVTTSAVPAPNQLKNMKMNNRTPDIPAISAPLGTWSKSIWGIPPLWEADAAPIQQEHPAGCAPVSSGSSGARRLKCVREQHRDRHRADASRDGRDRARDLARRVEVHVAHQPVVGAVDAHVDDGRAGLDPVALDEPRAADRRDEDVCPAAGLREVRRARMADRDGRVGVEEQGRERAADEDRAPDDHGLGP